MECTRTTQSHTIWWEGEILEKKSGVTDHRSTARAAAGLDKRTLAEGTPQRSARHAGAVENDGTRCGARTSRDSSAGGSARTSAHVARHAGRTCRHGDGADGLPADRQDDGRHIEAIATDDHNHNDGSGRRGHDGRRTTDDRHRRRGQRPPASPAIATADRPTRAPRGPTRPTPPRSTRTSARPSADPLPDRADPRTGLAGQQRRQDAQNPPLAGYLRFSCHD